MRGRRYLSGMLGMVIVFSVIGIDVGFSDVYVGTRVVAKDATGTDTDIQAAINALPAGGGSVYIKEGTWEVTSPIAFPALKPVSLIGSGASVTIIKYTGALSSEGLLKVQGPDGWREKIVISDLTVDCNSKIHYGVWGNYVREVTIRNIIAKDAVWVTDWGFNIIIGVRDGGITIEGCRAFNTNPTDGVSGICFTNDGFGGDDRGIIRGNFVENVEVGIWLEDAPKDIIIKDNLIKDCQEGIRTGGEDNEFNNWGCQRVSIISNFIKGSSIQGIHVGDTGRYMTVSGNVIEGGSGYGIFARNLHNSSITANAVRGTVKEGIYVSDSSNNDVIGNSVYSCSGTDMSGIVISSGCIGMVIRGNVSRNNTGHGIFLDNIGGGAYPSNNSISSNICVNNVKDGIEVVDALNNVVSRNCCFDDQATKTQDYGIRESGTSSGNLFLANNCRDNAVAGIDVLNTADAAHNIPTAQ